MFSFLSQFWHGQALVELESKLSDVGLGVDDNVVTSTLLPTLVAHGDECAGKSTLLEELIQCDIFDIGKDMITRMVWVYKLRYVANRKKPRLILRMANKPFLETEDPAEVKRAIQSAHAEIKNSGIAILDQEGIIEIYSNSVPNIDIIDPPGSLAAPEKGEPSTLAETSRKIARKYVSRANHVILHVQSAIAYQRNSPAAGLLCECKFPNVITVLTKVDRAVDVRTSEPLGEFMEMFRSRDENCIAVSNYRKQPDMTFAEVREEESKFFIEYMSPADYQEFKHRFGMPSLLRKLNSMAEAMNREEWEKQRLQIEKSKLDSVRFQLDAVGFQYSTSELCSIVAEGMLKDDEVFLKTIKEAWEETKFQPPDKNEKWVNPEAVDVTNVFLKIVQEKILTRFDNVFQYSPKKLDRFQQFQMEFRKIFYNRLVGRNAAFNARWADMVKHLMLEHSTGSPNYTVERWVFSVQSCFIQNVLMKLNELNPDEIANNRRRQSNAPFFFHFQSPVSIINDDQEVGPPRVMTLKNVLESIGLELSCEESEQVKKKRFELQRQIGLFEDIILGLAHKQ